MFNVSLCNYLVYDKKKVTTLDEYNTHESEVASIRSLETENSYNSRQYSIHGYPHPPAIDDSYHNNRSGGGGALDIFSYCENLIEPGHTDHTLSRLIIDVVNIVLS